jgi:hypothetical protein
VLIRPWLALLDVEPQTAAGSVGVGADEFVDSDAVELIGEALGHSEVQVANGIGIDVGGVGEGTGPEDEFDVGASTAEAWIKSAAGDGFLELGNRTDRGIASNLDAVTRFTPDVHGGSTRRDHVDEKDAESPIRSGIAPPFFGCRIDSEEEAWPAWSVRWLGPAAEEFGVYELCEVLADRVVVESEEFGELRDIDWSVDVEGVAIDSVAGGVSKGTRLSLEDVVPI